MMEVSSGCLDENRERAFYFSLALEDPSPHSRSWGYGSVHEWDLVGQRRGRRAKMQKQSICLAWT